jgi:hypothetical protein
MRHLRALEVADVARGACQKPDVLDTTDRAADESLAGGHGRRAVVTLDVSHPVSLAACQ